jgi:hypothetical protein
MKYLLAALAIAFASPASAECAAGYTQITVPLCQQSTMAPGFYVATMGTIATLVPSRTVRHAPEVQGGDAGQ